MRLIFIPPGARRLDVAGLALLARAPEPLLAEAAGIPESVTYSQHIAPILQRSCENCHRADGVAPMPLTTYEEVRPWTRAIKQRTGIGPKAGVMPPLVHREEHRHPAVQE